MWGFAYFGVYAAWSWFFRAQIHSRLQRRAARRLGVEIVWVPATTFPVELWVWGLREARDSPLESRLAFGSAAAGLLGAFLPIALLCAFEQWSGGLPEAVTGALYLTTPLLFSSFLLSHLRWRAPREPPAVVLGLGAKHDL